MKIADGCCMFEAPTVKQLWTFRFIYLYAPSYTFDVSTPTLKFLTQINHKFFYTYKTRGTSGA